MAARRKRTQADPAHVVGYLRVSTAEQGDSGLGLAGQRATIEAGAAQRGWQVVTWHEDVLSGKNMRRPGLAAALADVEEGRAAALVVAKLDRVSRSVVDFSRLLERSQQGGWALVALDVAVDSSTPAGEAMSSMLAVFAQLERRLIGDRTRTALAAKKAQGIKLGRPSTMPTDVVARIVAEHQVGKGWSAIARELNEEGIPTAHGGATWHPSTVRSACLAAAR